MVSYLLIECLSKALLEEQNAWLITIEQTLQSSYSLKRTLFTYSQWWF